MTAIIREMRRVVNDIVDDKQKANFIVLALIKEFGGTLFYMPRNDYEMRNRELKSLHKKGVSPGVLATRYSLAVRTVHNIVKTP